MLGHGRLDEIRDAVVVDSQRFAARSQEIAAEIGRLNAELMHAGLPYVLIVVGRLGSSEPTLGVPVTQGSHFSQNLVTFHVGYFAVNPEAGEGFVNWTWLAAQPAVRERSGVRHLRLAAPLTVKMNGQEHRGVIVKPS